MNVPLEAETLAGAIKVGQYYLEHSMAAFDMMGLSDPQDVKDAKYIRSDACTWWHLLGCLRISSQNQSHTETVHLLC